MEVKMVISKPNKVVIIFANEDNGFGVQVISSNPAESWVQPVFGFGSIAEALRYACGDSLILKNANIYI